LLRGWGAAFDKPPEFNPLDLKGFPLRELTELSPEKLNALIAPRSLAQAMMQKPPWENVDNRRNHGRPWTEEDITQLKYLFHIDKSRQNIARRLGRTEGSIAARLEELGLAENPFRPNWTRYRKY
jgi:hypothetical protein